MFYDVRTLLLFNVLFLDVLSVGYSMPFYVNCVFFTPEFVVIDTFVAIFAICSTRMFHAYP